MREQLSRGNDVAKAMDYMLIQAWLADVLERIAEHPVQKLGKLLPWNWHQPSTRASQAA